MRYTLLLALAATGLLCRAQTPLLREGQAVFTFDAGCFSNGSQWSILVYDIRHTYEAEPGHNWNTGYLYPHTADSIYWQADSMGTVFGLTIDTVGNIYVAATSIYGPPTGIAGPGGIYKIDAFDWSVSKFMETGNYTDYDTSKNLMPNVGSGLGDICYDRVHDQLFVTNFEDGKIYRLDMNGNVLSVWDPFSPDDHTISAAPYGERVWAVSLYGESPETERLYFSRVVQDSYMDPLAEHNQVWSVGLDPVTGNFTGAAVKEFENNVFGDDTGVITNSPFSDICFDGAGNMYLAERTMQNLATNAHHSRVIKCPRIAGVYPSMQIYYLGNISSHDAAGGIDIGREYLDEENFICEEKIWASCDAARFSDPEYVYGLTAIPMEGNSNIITDENYYKWVNLVVDHDGELTASCIPKKNLGDVEIFKSCVGEVLCLIDYTDVFPNIITPNGDHLNDVLRLYNCREGELLIFNRWGDKIYSHKGFEISWNGLTLNGELVDEGVYYCVYKDKKINKNWFLHVAY